MSDREKLLSLNRFNFYRKRLEKQKDKEDHFNNCSPNRENDNQWKLKLYFRPNRRYILDVLGKSYSEVS